MDRFYREFGRLVRRARRRFPGHLTQADLGTKIGLKRSSISNIERGLQHVPLHKLYDLAAALGVAPADLLPPVKDTEQAEAVREMRRKGYDPRIIDQLAAHLVPEDSDESNEG